MSRTDAANVELVGIAVEASQPSGSAVGIVDDASEGAAVMLGKRVLVGPTDPCGQCEVCRRGGAAVCPHASPRGAVGKRLRVPSRWVVALQDGLELPLPAAAAVAGDVTTAYTLYARTGLGPREPVVVLGENAVARFLVEILRGKGITPTVIVGATSDDAWRSWLLAKGAAVVSGTGDALVASVTGAVSAQGMGNRPWRVIATEASVVPHAAQLAGPRATLTVLADHETPALPGDLIAREVTVIGVAGPHPDLIVEAAALCVKGEIDLVGGVGDGPTLARVVAS
ncbi:MAG TPA: alcohol dehydrogenase catalytic domain-containing protein [Kofleriaceae bacterium]|nr:alcohol dehydrogenase catalytic domain-containing protein [Kofleriaceae bacterium]